MKERDCTHCEYYKHGEVIGAACSKWECVKEAGEDNEPDLDCALRD